MGFNFQDLVMHPWTLWLLIALVTAILEMAVPYFAFSFTSLAAVVAMLASFYLGLTSQILVFGVALMTSLLFVRPRLLAKFHKVHFMPSLAQALVGAKGRVTEAIDPATGAGRVLVNGQDWSARCRQPVAAGHVVEVENHDGIVLIVREA